MLLFNFKVDVLHNQNHGHPALSPHCSLPLLPLSIIPSSLPGPRELLSRPLQPLTIALLINQIPSKPHRGHLTLHLPIKASPAHYTVVDVFMFSLQAETSSLLNQREPFGSPESGAAAAPHSSFYHWMFFQVTSFSVQRGTDGLYLEKLS